VKEGDKLIKLQKINEEALRKVIENTKKRKPRRN